MTNDADKTPEQIEQEIERDRLALRDRLHDLQDELSLDGLSRRVTEQLREHGSEWANSAGEAARANPIALALTGVGLAWMIFGRGYDPTHMIDRHGDNDRHDPPPPPRYRGPVSSAPALPAASSGLSASSSGSLGSSSGSSASTAGGSTSTSGLSASPSGVATASRTPRAEPDWATSSLRGTKYRRNTSTDDQESSMSDKVKNRARHLRDRLSEGTEHLSEEGRRRVRDARERAIRAREAAGRRFGGGSGKVSQGYETEPLVFGAAAFLLGAGLATLLPRTRREEEMLGSYGDQLFEEAEAIYSEEMEKVKRAVSAGIEEAKSSATDVKNAAANELSDTSKDNKGSGSSSGSTNRNPAT